MVTKIMNKEKMMLQMLVELENAETPTFLMVKSSVIDLEMLVMNTLHQTQKAGAEATMKEHSTQTQCVALVVEVAQLEMKVQTKVITKAVMKVKMKALTKVKKKEKMMQ